MRRRAHILGFGALAALVLIVAAPGRSRSELPPVAPLPLLGVADSETILMGAAPAGEPGEAWGYRELPLAVGGVRVGTRELAFGPVTDPSQPEQQLAFMRHTDANGWQAFDVPVDEGGSRIGGLSRTGSRRGSRRTGAVSWLDAISTARRENRWSSSSMTRAPTGTL